MRSNIISIAVLESGLRGRSPGKTKTSTRRGVMTSAQKLDDRLGQRHAVFAFCLHARAAHSPHGFSRSNSGHWASSASLVRATVFGC
jgi:hypothetical protein